MCDHPEYSVVISDVEYFPKQGLKVNYEIRKCSICDDQFYQEISRVDYHDLVYDKLFGEQNV